ncbi:hypothetical protein [Piscirickettsia salmonis]|nr:hypothetical protein [Piscirickettsia salmonis]
MLGDFASLDVQNTYRGSDAYVEEFKTSMFLPLYMFSPYIMRDPRGFS